ncbi:S-adenosyl-L-methionine-dependent methyltransferases superfamily protein [Perilla frutescens var. hirtella]|uniref:S-adenosyl-L-methionine-dependent methyltransferases superfamily protein n=1 Tax=Perilla frutescens var. hirtella TaxID=608512 RepID=A0AAD4IWT4_PERFH|nr:S-adenosyl-L-methionine-dependent methyltransferases superfamily protein [Perilla frutescens var. hirtella]
MGGRGKSRTQRKHFSQNRENVWKRPKSDGSAIATPADANNGEHRNWEPFKTQNPAFDEYYKEQGIVSVEEWDTFNNYLRTPLPAAFRINSSSQFYKDLLFRLENDFMKSLPAEDTDGNAVEAIKVLPWYPDNLAWQSYFSRNQLRKNQALEQFHEFLKLENEIGNITRQEAVSMVPPLFLDVRPDHFILDMCAAPGSKTFQLLEMIYKLTEPGTLPSGMIIANDLDVQRCNLLIHQTKRMCTANLIVTNHEAQHFPSCHLPRNAENVKEHGLCQLQFDRVLCDVPCSGDGTFRKAPDMWKKWNSGMANGLFGLQVQIAMRGLALLKVGGRMVYSTCSMNPVENEAVVAEVLRRCEGTVELIDVSTELPQLARRPGLKSWKVRDKGLWLASYKDVRRYRKSVATPGMFPSGKSYDEISEPDLETTTVQICENSNGSNENGVGLIDDSVAPTSNLEAEVSDLPLERCMRIVPHDQNSGAFFIAVFHKLLPLPAPTAIQKKSRSLPRKVPSNAESQKQMNEVKEDKNGDDIVVSGEIDVQISEAAPDASLHDTGISETHLNTDQNKIHEQNEKEKTEPSPDVEADAKTVPGKRKLQMQGRWRGVDPVVFYKDETVVSKIMEFYGIKESFPFKGHLITRNSDMSHVKRVYYISNSVKQVLELNLLGGQQLKIAAVGLKMFERQTSKEGSSAPCLFRISSEGLPLILPHITKQIIYASPIDFKHLLKYKSIKFPDFVDPSFREAASELILGCCVVILRTEGWVSSGSGEDATPIAIGCWRGRTNISVMVNANDCQELLERVSALRADEADAGVEEVVPMNPIPERGADDDVPISEAAEEG